MFPTQPLTVAPGYDQNWRPRFGYTTIADTLAFSINSHGEHFDRATKDGFQSMMIMSGGLPASDLPEIGRRAKSGNIEIMGLSATVATDADNPACPISSDSAHREKAKELTVLAMEQTKAMANPDQETIVHFTPLCAGLMGTQVGDLSAEQIDCLVAHVREMDAEAARIGIELAVEILNRWEHQGGPNTLDDGARMLDKAGVGDHTGFGFDTFHQTLGETDIVSAWIRHRHRMKAIHISDEGRGRIGAQAVLRNQRLWWAIKHVIQPKCPLTFEAVSKQSPEAVFPLLNVRPKTLIDCDPWEIQTGGRTFALEQLAAV